MTNINNPFEDALKDFKPVKTEEPKQAEPVELRKEEYTSWNPRINNEQIPFGKLVALNGKVIEFILNGDKWTPDGREFPLVALVNISGLEFNDENKIKLVLRCQKNNGFKGGVLKYEGSRAKNFLNGLYSIEEVGDISGREFSEAV